MKCYRPISVALLLALATSGPAWGQRFFTAKFSADQETHVVTSSATGTAVLGFDEGELSFFITVEGLSGPITGAHFHNAPAGVEGGVGRNNTTDRTVDAPGHAGAHRRARIGVAHR